jgi:hypothetical protein
MFKVLQIYLIAQFLETYLFALTNSVLRLCDSNVLNLTWLERVNILVFMF